MSFLELINHATLPLHIAIIMDGNGRWAKKKGALRIFGHNNAVQAIRDVSEAAAELQIKFITLYAFSTENWNRPKDEVNALMNLLIKTIVGETKTLSKNNIILNTIGNTADLPKDCQVELFNAIEATKNNTGLVLTLALSYSGRWEIVEAARHIAKLIKNNTLQIDDITENEFSKYLCTYPMPDPELLIRTSGELRISNYMLWQLAYTELYITDILWPDFNKENFYEAIVDFQKRERRFGKTSEQISIK